MEGADVIKKSLTLVAAAMLTACASVPYENPDDPWERYNRTMFQINDTVDKAVTKPLAQVYDAAAPLPVRTGIGNFFGNISDLWIGANNLMQGKASDGLSDVGRVLINTTLGILGLFDVATEMGIEKHDEDFGQTLAVWGVPSGPYFVVPFFGPRTLRGAGALPLDLYASGAVQLSDVAARNSVSLLRLVHQRANLLGADRAVEQGSLDRYAYIRDFYLQQRRYEIYDGNPPRERFDDGAHLDGGANPHVLAQVEADTLAQVSLKFALVRPFEDARPQ
jgi:phospholipid-binding lipoprotein MlaA